MHLPIVLICLCFTASCAVQQSVSPPPLSAHQTSKVQAFFKKGNDLDGEAALQYGYDLNQLQKDIGAHAFNQQLKQLPINVRDNYTSLMKIAKSNDQLSRKHF